jgi:hypothetical protein
LCLEVRDLLFPLLVSLLPLSALPLVFLSLVVSLVALDLEPRVFELFSGFLVTLSVFSFSLCLCLEEG